jgi:hypothetical protein
MGAWESGECRRLGGALFLAFRAPVFPTLDVGDEQLAKVIAEALASAQNSVEVIDRHTDDVASLIPHAGNLIQISAYRTDRKKRTSEFLEFLRGQRRQPPEVSPDQ